MNFHDFVVIIHIALGATGLFYFGLIIFFARKGTKRHKKAGMGYVIVMLGCMLLGIPLSWIKGDVGFLVSCVIVLLLIISGWLDIHNKGDKADQGTSSNIAFLFAIMFLVLLADTEHYKSKMPKEICMFFLAFAACACSLHLFGYNFGLTHAGKMMASYFVSFAGFAVNSLQPLISTGSVFWLSITFAILFPLILLYFKKPYGNGMGD